jgi:hypothetical protein
VRTRACQLTSPTRCSSAANAAASRLDKKSSWEITLADEKPATLLHQAAKRKNREISTNELLEVEISQLHQMLADSAGRALREIAKKFKIRRTNYWKRKTC